MYLPVDWLIYHCPHIIAVVFVVILLLSKRRAKAQIFFRALLALVIVTFLAHVNRIFHLYPPLLYFPSGHMTFCLGVSVSLALLQPWTLSMTVPFLLIFGIDLVRFSYHSEADVLGAFPLVLIVYGTIHALWRIPKSTAPLTPPLDRAKVST